MKLGLLMPTTEHGGGPLRPDSLAQAAARIEDAGFDGIWANDSIGRPYPSVDPLTVLTVAATVTTRVDLGTCVLQVPLRRPAELAHRVLSTHLVCGDRLVLGVGAGSTRADFAACEVAFDRRFELLDEGLAALDAVYSAGAPRIVGWPATARRPPVLLGAWGAARAVTRAAAELDGWIGSAKKGGSVDDVVTRFRSAGGGRAVLTTIEVDLEVTGTEDGPTQGFHLRCGPAVARNRLAYLADLGVDDVVLRSPRTDAATLATLRSLVP